MKIQITLAILFFAFTFSGKAQYKRFPMSGAIRFEKSVNMYALIRNMSNGKNSAYMGNMLDEYKKSNPQFRVSQSTLLFSEKQTLFTPDKVEANAESGFFEFSSADQSNTVYTELTTGRFITQKVAFNETFLVKDSVRKINWKITSELREIAGYECRRANAIILDSIYVVAFYTDQIPVSAGPESFQGLPGMILGVALPHEHITWFAKSVSDKSIPAADFKAPAKGKPMDNKGFADTINKVLKQWGEFAGSALKMLLL